MIYLSQIKPKNDSLVSCLSTLVVLLAPLPFIAVGVGMIIGGITQKLPILIPIGLALAATGIWIGYILFKNLTEPVKKRRALFLENDVFVDPSGMKLRDVDRIALEKFGGELKPALRHVAESPDFFRQDRLKIMADWCDFERDYVQAFYGKDLLHIAQVSKTHTLTFDRIETDVRHVPRVHQFSNRDFEIIKAACTKQSAQYDTDGTQHRFYLYFGDLGRFSCSHLLHSLTHTGDEFYVIRILGRKDLSEAYPLADWSLDESLRSVVRSCDP